MKKAVIVIPTYNESRNIKRLLEEIFTVTKILTNWDLEIVVVDSNSPDKTGSLVEKLQKTNIHLHLLSMKKEGLGKAYIKGLTYALERFNPDIVFEMDADLSHDPKKIPAFLKKIEDGADFVVGSRYIKGGSIPKNWGLHRKLFSVLGNLIIRVGMMKFRITDWTSGYRAIRTWIVKETLPQVTEYTGYVFQVALLHNATLKGARVEEVPIHFVDREHGVSKINSFQYIWQTLMYVLFESSFIKFLVVGTIGFTIDFTLSYFFIERISMAVWAATLISVETALVCNFILNNFWSFAHKSIKPTLLMYLYKFFKFNLVSAGSLIIQSVGIQLAVNTFGRTYWYLYKAGIIILVIIPYSYILYNKVIWKEKK